MTAGAIIGRAIAAGISARVDGNRLVLSAAKRPDDRLLDDLRRAKPEIVEYLRGLADWTALFDERAAIIEFDGGFERRDAEDRAKSEIDALRQFALASPHD